MINERPMAQAVYIVTDVECDGPRPGANSMLSFASVAVTSAGEEIGAFEACLEPLPDASADPQTLEWFGAHPEAWSAATADPRQPGEVMQAFEAWVRSFEVGRVFAAYPLAFDGSWIDFYLRRFTAAALVEGHYAQDRLFDGSGLCLKSFAAGVTARPPWDCKPSTFPPAWLGDHPHSHRAIDDARGYGSLLGTLMRLSRTRSPSSLTAGR